MGGARLKHAHACAGRPYLDLPVVADGSDGRRGPQGALRAAGPELDHRLGPAHQAGHRAAVQDQLLLLLLRGGGVRHSCSQRCQTSMRHIHLSK